MRYRASNVAADEVVAEASLRLARRPGADQADDAGASRTGAARRSREGADVRQRVEEPAGELTAGRLLEQAGMKGFAVGGARISPVHANFIENTGGASSADVVALMAESRRRVRERFGVELVHEVQMLGDIDLPAA